MSTNPVPSQNSNALSILAIIFGGISVLILPILFGPIGIVLGIIAKTRKERLSTVGLIICWAGNRRNSWCIGICSNSLKFSNFRNHNAALSDQ